MKHLTLRSTAACLFAASLALAHGAVAVDGVIELNQARIVKLGGFPYTLPTAGSYVLTGNLSVPAATNGLVAGVNNIEINLNGFNITSAGGSPAFGVSSGGHTNITVRKGTIRGFASAGTGGVENVLEVHLWSNGIAISACYGGLIENNVIEASSTYGISASWCKIQNNVIDASGVGIRGDNNLILHNRIMGNAVGGIQLLLGVGSTIEQNRITDNTGFGISDLVPGAPPVPPSIGVARSIIIGNTIDINSGAGIAIVHPAVITDNNVSSSGGAGIVCGAACTVRGNTIESNGFGTGGGGITVGAGSTVDDNTISFNTPFGLSIPVTAGYRNNTLNANAGFDAIAVPPGAHPTSGAGNLCSGVLGPAATCP